MSSEALIVRFPDVSTAEDNRLAKQPRIQQNYNFAFRPKAIQLSTSPRTASPVCAAQRSEEMSNSESSAQLFNTANRMFISGKFTEAREYFQKFLGSRPSTPKDELDVTALQNIGVSLKKQGDLDSAIQYYEKALVLARELRLLAPQADNVSNIGVIHKNRAKKLNDEGKTKEAKELFKKAEAMYSEAKQLDYALGNMVGVASDLLNLGIVAYHVGERSKALGAFEECIRIALENGASVVYAKAKCAMGNVYIQTEKWDKAIHCIEDGLQSATLFTANDGVWTVAVGLANLGIAYFNKGDKVKAATCLRQADAIFQHMEIDDKDVRVAREYLARCH